MRSEADEIYEQANAITEALADPSLDETERLTLERERENLRSQARDIASATRHPRSIETEIAMIEERLATIEGMRISKGYSEKHLARTIQDPGAYRHTINRLLDEEHEAEVRSLEERLTRLRAIAAREREGGAES